MNRPNEPLGASPGGWLKPLSQFQEEEASWLIPGWLPEGQITLLAAEGGVGKTTIWCHILAALSAGRPCLLDPEGLDRPPIESVFLTTEDSVKKKLARKLRLAGACMPNVYAPDLSADSGALRSLKFGTGAMERFLRERVQKLFVFDPIQGFLPPQLNMGSRNAMRDALSPLVTLGEQTGATFLIVVHTNKRKGAYGRDRIADSADLWDIARSVWMAGYTGEPGIRYLSNEKNNYAALQETRLFSVNEAGLIVPEGTSRKRDREYQQESMTAFSAPVREACKDWTAAQLDGCGGSVPSKALEEAARREGFSARTLRRAKDELKAEGAIRYFKTGGKDGGWNVALAQPELPASEVNEPLPV